ncbi:MAG: hypothetical protein NG747_13390 [Candidatus Brocadia sp.]|nr:hypothetical protein [Candidatus Brocadia sp.]
MGIPLMGSLRAGVSSVTAIHNSASLLAGKKPILEIGDAAHGGLRAGVASITAIHNSANLLAGKKPTLEVGDSSHGSLRVNIDIIDAIHSASGLLAGKKPTIDVGNYLTESEYVPAKLEVPIRTGLTHWHIDALGGTLMEDTMRGAIDGAVYAVDATGKITIPEVDNGDVVTYIKGVYLTNVTVQWFGFWADIYDDNGLATNYYQSHIKSGNDTVITLNVSLAEGTQVQVYYLYNTNQSIDRYTYVHSYPCLFKGAGGPYPIEANDPGDCKLSSAVDSDEMFVMACMEAYLNSNDSRFYTLATTMIKALRYYDNNAADYSYLDEMNYTPYRTQIDWYYAVGDPAPAMLVVYDPSDSQNMVLKITSSALSYSIVGKSRDFAIASSNRFQMDFIGEGNNLLYLVESCNDPNKADTVDKRFYYAFLDISSEKRNYSFTAKDFRSRKNVVFSDLNNSYSGGYKGSTAQQTAGVEISTYMENASPYNLAHYRRIKNSWDFTVCYESPGEVCYPDPESPAGPPICEPLPPPTQDAYAGVFCTFDSGQITSGSYSGVNFYMQISTAGTYRFIVKDDNNIQFHANKSIASSQRVTINWNEFTYYAGGAGNETMTHPLYQIYFEANSSPTTGSFYIWDVKFGDHDFIQSYNISLWQLKLPTGNHTVYMDNVGFNKVIVDAYKGTPYFSYQWSSAGIDPWLGPTYTAYVMPGIYHIMGYAQTALTQIQFMKDAQDDYKNKYGGSYGPFMPVHTRTRIENTVYGDMNSWTWGAPNWDTQWGGYMYRAIEQAARYYYYTNNGTAKTILDRWMSWLNTNIIEDDNYPEGPSNPQGYLPPAEYVQWSGNWNYAYYSPDFHALIVQAMIFKYWKDGDTTAYTWYRRLLDDLIYNRKAVNGSYPQGAKTFGFHQGEVGKALGMLINGRKGATVNHTLSATNDDKDAFEELYAYFYNNVGGSKPCALSPEWLPMHQRETVTYGNNEKKWVINNASLTEGISICMYFAVDYAIYDSSEYGRRWLGRLYQFLYNAVIADKDW